MSVALELAYDKYEAQRNQAESSDSAEFQAWKDRVGMILDFTFCNGKAVSCQSESGERKTLLLDYGEKKEENGIKPTTIQVHNVCLETHTIVFEIIHHPDENVFNEYLKGKHFSVSKCYSFSIHQYKGMKGQVVHECAGTHQNFLTGWFDNIKT